MKKQTIALSAAIALLTGATGATGYTAYKQRETIASLEKKRSNLQESLIQTEDRLDTATVNLDKVSATRNELQAKLDEATVQLGDMTAQRDKTIADYESLAEQKAALEKEVRSLKQQTASVSPRPVTVKASAPVSPEIQSPAPSVAAEAVGEWMTFRASFYNGAGITKSGRPTVDGFTVATDPSIIPLGTMLEILYPDGHIEKRRADDTGGLIKGYRLDIFEAASEAEIMRLGVQQVKVRVLKTS